MIETITTLQGPAGGLFIGLGIGQVLHGHSYGYLLITAGLVASAPYLVLATLRIWRRRER